jgi:hypothetical protein
MKGFNKRAAALVAYCAALLRRQAIDLALDRKQHVDLLDRFDRDRRLLQPRQLEELAPRMRLIQSFG